jgi:hypothetical protein
MNDKPIVDGRNIRFVVPDVDYNAAEAVCCIQLTNWTFQNSQTCNIEAFEEYLAYSFVGVSGQAWR